jgi:hypothetical protein
MTTPVWIIPGWLGGILFAFAAIGSASESIGSVIALAIVALLLLLPSRAFFGKASKITLPIYVRAIAILLLIAVAGALAAYSTENNRVRDLESKNNELTARVQKLEADLAKSRDLDLSAAAGIPAVKDAVPVVKTVPLPPAPPVPAPVKEPEVIAVAPDLKVIPVNGHRTITNARVLSVHSDGLVFICDDGMVQALYTDLPPGFRAYYAKKAEPDASEESDLAPPPPSAPAQSYSGSSPQETDEQRAQDRLYNEQRIQAVQSSMAQNEGIIERYETQVDFDKNVSDAEYQSAKTNLAQNKMDLARLQSSPEN